MATSALFKLQAGSQPLKGDPHSQIYNCPQWNERAYVRGTVSGVKAFALHNNDFCLFLDKSVNIDIVSNMQMQLKDFTSHNATQRYSVKVASEDELATGRSDYQPTQFAHHPRNLLIKRPAQFEKQLNQIHRLSNYIATSLKERYSPATTSLAFRKARSKDSENTTPFGRFSLAQIK